MDADKVSNGVMEQRGGHDAVFQGSTFDSTEASHIGIRKHNKTRQENIM